MSQHHTIIALATFVLGCAGGTTATQQAVPVAPPDSFAAQAALGQTLYGQHCAGCHGASGEGASAPPVVGLAKGALPLDPPAKAQHRKGKFVTVGDVADFVMKNMPAKAPGSLPPEDYLAILAFDLKANGITLPEKLTLEKAKTLPIPR